MQNVRIITGTRRSERREKIDALVRENWPRACLLLPSKAAARARREKLFLGDGLPGALGVRIVSLMEFAEALLNVEGRHVRRMENLERKFLLQDIVSGIAAGDALPPEAKRHLGQPGFTSHLLRIITDLKQSTVEPAVLANVLDKLPEPLGLFDGVVVGAYQAYQDAIKERRIYDVPGMYWEAHQVCAEAKPRMLRDISFVALDGFDDFTPSEMRFLVSLARHLEGMAIGLHFDVSPNRMDIFQIPRKTRDRLRKEFSNAAIDTCGTPPAETRVQFAADNLFWRDKPVINGKLADNLEIRPCLNTRHEIEWVARDIKAAIRNGEAAPGEIAVVYRHLDSHADTIRATFKEYGIPLDMAHQPSLAEHELGITIQTLLSLRGQWHREDALYLLCSPSCGALHEAGDRPPVFPMLVAYAQIIGGEEEWEQRLGDLHNRLQRGNDRTAQGILRRVPDALAQLGALRRRLDALRRIVGAFPDTATVGVYLDTLQSALEELGVCAPLADTPKAPPPARRTWENLVLRWAVSTQNAAPLAWRDFSTLLGGALREAKAASEKDTSGVRCTEPEHLRGLAFKRVYLAHLIERDFPAPASTNAIYGDHEQEILGKQGVTFGSAADHSAHERMLLHHILEAAQEKLIITWPMIKADGREASPSSFMDAVSGVFETSPLPDFSIPHADGFLPAPGEIASPRELAQLAFHSAKAWQQSFAELLAPALAGAKLEAARADTATGFGTEDACMQSEDVRELLAKKFNADRVYSPSQLETYLECPFRYWKQYVLGIEETEKPVMAFDPLVRGVIVHEVLENFHRHYKGLAAQDIPLGEGLQLLEGLASQAFDAHAWKSTTATDSIQRVEFARVLRQLRRYFQLQHDKKRNDGARWKPEYFEAAFGAKNGGNQGELLSEEPYLLEIGGESVKLSGRIDRVDLVDGGARIIDYKSGGVPAQKDIEAGTSLQLHIYKWALEGLLLPGTECIEARYISIRNGEEREALKGAKPKKKPLEREEAVQLGIISAVNGIQGGVFAPIRRNDRCMGCAAARACRYDENRVAAKSAHMPGMPQPETSDPEEG